MYFKAFEKIYVSLLCFNIDLAHVHIHHVQDAEEHQHIPQFVVDPIPGQDLVQDQIFK